MSLFSVAAGGVLTQLSGAPYAAGSQPTAVAFSPLGTSSGTLMALADYAGAGVAMVNSVPSTLLTSPGSGATYSVGQPIATGFSCTENVFGPV